MKIKSLFLLILFVSFLGTPTVVTYLNKNVDVSMAFTASEEENSVKNQIVFEYTIQDSDPDSIRIHFSHGQAALNHSYKNGATTVVLEVLSPPPKQA